MSQPGGVDMVRRSDSPGSLKRKRGLADYTNSIRSQAGSTKTAKLADGATSSSSLLRTTSTSSGGQHYRSPDSDELQQSDSGDLLHGVGSASSLTSAASSVFSHNSHAAAQNRALSHANGLTPLTNHTDSSPPKTLSPRAAQSSVGMPAPNGTHATSSLPFPHASHDISKPHGERPSMHLSPGTAKGYRAVWDPDLESRLSREERKRATVRRKEFGLETYQPNPPPDPRLAIPGYTAGNCRGKERPSKAIFRVAPYNLPQFKVDKNSVGPGEAQHVVVRGFDPFLPEATLKLNFEQFGSVSSVQSKTDPATGSYLGIASIKFRDTTRNGMEVQAVLAVKQAEAEMHGHRIGLNTISVEADREGRRCKRYVESALKKAREERDRKRPSTTAPPPPPPPESSTPQTDSPAPPPNAPKGPSGRPSAATRAPPEGPRGAAASSARSGAGPHIEDDLVLSKIKRKPYIHIPHASVPVLITTIPHLKKRLKSYDWREIRLDRTGYYVVFDDSKRGEDETERCFAECNNAALFTYTMQMECQKYGNPNYERSPSPERVMQAKLKKEEIERLKREEAEDIEIEKKNRAENLDPVKGALDQLRLDLRNKIFEDIKQRVAFPILQESLDPARHTAKRRKLGLPDPLDLENRAPSLLFNKPGDTPPQTPRGRHGQHSRPLRPHDPHSHRGRRGGQREREREPTNVFLDERRRRPAPRPSHARGLHFKLQQLYPSDDEDSDDERRTSVTRDIEDQESRPLSRASRTSTPFDGSESVAETPNKRRKVADWEEEEKEVFTDEQKRHIGHLLHKEPEDLALRELETVVSTLPRSSKYATRARTELFIRQRTRDDDALFQVKTEKDKEKEKKVHVVDVAEDSDVAAPVPDRLALLDMDDAAITALAKKKKKSKEKIIEQQLALRARANQAKVAKKPAEQKKVIQQIEEKDRELIAVKETETPREPHLSVTYDKPRRTVEDDLDVVLDIDGWQDAIKDDEDLMFAKQAVAHEIIADIGDVKFWAYKQKEIKALNTGTQGAVHSESGIEGYYVANSTGSARTEGVKKILNEEKSKYLPHRIKVQKAREERQAQAKANPTAAAEAAKIAAAEKIASTASSRSNRVNNRRLVNDINLQKQTLAATSTNTDADVAIRFNQLKKRKKHVKFERSAIHGWGLYAEENIAINDLIIEYVGEKVRQKVADMREIRYEKQGVGSSYLFRMMDDEIVDATKKGGIARFINHSCNPNCTAKIIKVEGTPRIVIYALKDIAKNEELTYDYKFEREYGSTDRIPCLCGSANCKGFLN